MMKGNEKQGTMEVNIFSWQDFRKVQVGGISYLWEFNQLKEVSKVWRAHRDMDQ